MIPHLARMVTAVASIREEFRGGLYRRTLLRTAAGALNERTRQRIASLARCPGAVLCPHCLRFGRLTFHCAACDRTFPFPIHRSGLLHRLLLPCPGRGSPDHLQLRCSHCIYLLDETELSFRPTLLMTLGRDDYELLRETGGLEVWTPHAGAGHFRLRPPRETWVFVRPLQRFPVSFAADSALRRCGAIWVGQTGALELARRADAFIERLDLTPQERRALEVCVAAPRPAAEVVRLLEARFGRVRSGVSPREFLRLDGLPSEPREAVV